MKVPKRKIKISSVLAAGVLFLNGCAGVGPEKRAFPLALSVDAEEGEYVVIYAMADLSLMTGQGKDQGESGESQNTGSVFRGQSFEEIQEQYDSSQEYMLDLGHVQALILGDGLLQDEEKRQELFEEIGGSTVIGRNLYLFRTEKPELVMEQNGKEKDSVGEFLAGFYENQPGRTEHRPVTLEDFFYEWSNDGTVPELPRLVCREGQIFLEEPEASK